MSFTDILSFCFSVLGLYGLLHYLRYLIPRNVPPRSVPPRVAIVLAETKHLLDRAESTGVILQRNDYRSALTSYEAVISLTVSRVIAEEN
jgi:hypothetical protein